MAMDQCQENAAVRTDRNDRIDQGYKALREGNWNQADQIFHRLLEEDPHCGMSCLGLAMAEKQIHGREELAEIWSVLKQDSDFIMTLNPAKPDFFPWLQKDMAAAQEEKKKWTGADSPYVSSEKKQFIEFPEIETGRRILLIFSAVQVVLYFTVAICFERSDPETESCMMKFAASLILAAIASGLPVILGPLYGNSIVEAGSFCRLLKILNNTVSCLGCFLHGILATACYLSLRESSPALLEDKCFFYIFIVSFFIHLLSLIVPIVLDEVEYGDWS